MWWAEEQRGITTVLPKSNTVCVEPTSLILAVSITPMPSENQLCSRLFIWCWDYEAVGRSKYVEETCSVLGERQIQRVTDSHLSEVCVCGNDADCYRTSVWLRIGVNLCEDTGSRHHTEIHTAQAMQRNLPMSPLQHV